MINFFIEREFLEKQEEVVVHKEKDALRWIRIPYEGAKAKYKFNIFWRKMGNIPEYRLCVSSPGVLWQQMSGLPGEATFEEARLKDYHIVYLCKAGMRQPGAFMKIPAPK